MRTFVLGLLALSALVAASAAAAAPRLSVSPTSSPPGRLVTVTGRGFCAAAGCSGVTIEIYGAPVARGVRVSAGGRFVRAVRVPGGPDAGQVGVVATQHLAAGRDARALALLTIVLRTRPPSTNPGTTVTITTAPEPTTEPAPATTAPATTATTPPVTGPTATQTAPSTAPSPTQSGTTGTAATTAPTASTVAAGPVSEDEGDGPWLWLAVLAAVGVVVAAAGWGLSRARPRR
jgi:hypothetical protein